VSDPYPIWTRKTCNQCRAPGLPQQAEASPGCYRATYGVHTLYKITKTLGISHQTASTYFD